MPGCGFFPVVCLNTNRNTSGSVAISENRHAVWKVQFCLVVSQRNSVCFVNELLFRGFTEAIFFFFFTAAASIGLKPYFKDWLKQINECVGQTCQCCSCPTPADSKVDYFMQACMYTEFADEVELHEANMTIAHWDVQWQHAGV